MGVEKIRSGILSLHVLCKESQLILVIVDQPLVGADDSLLSPSAQLDVPLFITALQAILISVSDSPILYMYTMVPLLIMGLNF